MALDGFVKARIGLELGPVNVERHAQNEMAKIFNFCTLTVLILVAGIIEKVADGKVSSSIQEPIGYYKAVFIVEHYLVGLRIPVTSRRTSL